MFGVLDWVQEFEFELRWRGEWVTITDSTVTTEFNVLRITAREAVGFPRYTAAHFVSESSGSLWDRSHESRIVLGFLFLKTRRLSLTHTPISVDSKQCSRDKMSAAVYQGLISWHYYPHGHYQNTRAIPYKDDIGIIAYSSDPSLLALFSLHSILSQDAIYFLRELYRGCNTCHRPESTFRYLIERASIVTASHARSRHVIHWSYLSISNV